MSDLVGNPNCWFSHAQAHAQAQFIVLYERQEKPGIEPMIPGNLRQVA